jgi:hypothetical protein
MQTCSPDRDAFLKDISVELSRHEVVKFFLRLLSGLIGVPR